MKRARLRRETELVRRHGRHEDALEALQQAGSGSSGRVCRSTVLVLLQLDRVDQALETLTGYCRLPEQRRGASDGAWVECGRSATRMRGVLSQTCLPIPTSG